MNDLRRTLLWSVFAFSLLMLWDGWLRHTGQPTLFGPQTAASAAQQAAPGASSAQAGASQAQGGTATAAAPAGGASAPAPAVPRELVVVTTDTVRATVDSQGGSLVKLELLKHADDVDRSRHVTVLDQSGTRTYLAQTALEGPAGKALPDQTTPMTVVPGERTLREGQDAVTLRLESVPVDGVKRAITYTFPRGGYVIGVKQEVTNGSPAAVSPRVSLRLVRDGEVPASHGFFGAPTSYTGPAVFSEAAKFQKVEFKHIEDGKAEYAKSASDGWVAMIQHYFASAWLHTAPDAREFFARKLSPNLYAVGMNFALGDIAPGQTKAFDAQLFVGPQEEKKLEAIAPGLEYVKDYGLVHILAKPLFWLLHFIHEHVVANWGWSIVLLVVLLKGAFYWLNASAYRSMAKMKAINPRVQELRERYKDNPQQMQQEMLKIYREEKVNPVGGCLPIVVQIPVFIALYWVLLSSVEMRNAPWVGWIHDLSAKDPYYVLPLLMTLSTLLQTWLNPTPPDPMQAKMMWIMPLVFSVMFFFFPAGLVLYWLTNNLLSIAQQWFINRQIDGGSTAPAKG